MRLSDSRPHRALNTTSDQMFRFDQNFYGKNCHAKAKGAEEPDVVSDVDCSRNYFAGDGVLPRCPRGPRCHVRRGSKFWLPETAVERAHSIAVARGRRPLAG